MTRIHRMILLGAALALVLPLLGGCARGPSSGRVTVDDRDGYLDLAFSDQDRSYIKDYYRSSRNLPPGLAKKKRLPPGLEKQLERRGTLPPGLSAKYLPRDLESRLSQLPAGCLRLRVGGDVVLLHEKTRVILDLVQVY
jgi:hypothetical protein